MPPEAERPVQKENRPVSQADWTALFSGHRLLNGSHFLLPLWAVRWIGLPAAIRICFLQFFGRGILEALKIQLRQILRPSSVSSGAAE